MFFLPWTIILVVSQDTADTRKTLAIAGDKPVRGNGLFEITVDNRDKTLL